MCMHVLQLHAIYIHVYSLVAANFRLNNIVCFFMNRSTAQISPNCVTYHVIYELKLLSTGLVLPLEKEKPTIYAKTLHAYCLEPRIGTFTMKMCCSFLARTHTHTQQLPSDNIFDTQPSVKFEVSQTAS